MPQLTTLFADISDSTALLERHGSQRTRALFRRLLQALGDIAEHHQGKLVKTIGDEALCLFPHAGAAVEAAIAMQKHVAGSYFLGEDAIGIRIGLFHGDVAIELNDVFGDGVNVAARVVALANRGQILADATSLAAIQPPPSTRVLGPISVKGKQHPLEVVELLWEDHNTQLTSMARVLDTGALQKGQLLHLRLAGREMVFYSQDMPLSIGRDESSAVFMTSATVSRHHAVIEYNGGQFVFTDKSSNGSWLRLGGELVRVHRSSVILFGQGEIHCGSVYDSQHGGQAEHVLYFLLGDQ